MTKLKNIPVGEIVEVPYIIDDGGDGEALCRVIKHGNPYSEVYVLELKKTYMVPGDTEVHGERNDDTLIGTFTKAIQLAQAPLSVHEAYLYSIVYDIDGKADELIESIKKMKRKENGGVQVNNSTLSSKKHSRYFTKTKKKKLFKYDLA